jgi:hypothetical protein
MRDEKIDYLEYIKSNEQKFYNIFEKYKKNYITSPICIIFSNLISCIFNI